MRNLKTFKNLKFERRCLQEKSKVEWCSEWYSEACHQRQLSFYHSSYFMRIKALSLYLYKFFFKSFMTEIKLRKIYVSGVILIHSKILKNFINCAAKLILSQSLVIDPQKNEICRTFRIFICKKLIILQ